MPLTHLLDPEGNRVELDDAPMVFDQAGIMPAEEVQMVIDDARSYTRGWPFLSPSGVDPEKNCRRKVLLQRLFPYGETPTSAAARIEGTHHHTMYEESEPKGLVGWHREVTLPEQPENPAEAAKPDLPHTRILVVGGKQIIRQIELFPGFWTRMRLDRASPDWKTIIDFKFPKYPWTPRYKGDPWKGKALQYENANARDDWPIQLSCYSRAIKLLYDVDVEEAFVWRRCRGAQLPEATFRKIPVRLLSADELWKKIKGFVESTTGWLEEANKILNQYEDGPEKEESLKTLCKPVPMDGQDRNIMNGWLCNEGCPMKPLCFDLAGMRRF